MTTKSRWLFGAMAAASLLAAAAPGCGGGDGSSSSSNFGGGGPSTGPGGTGAEGGGETIPIVSLAIVPATAALEVDQTTKKSVTFQAIGKLADGTEKPVPAAFSVDNLAPGDVDPSSGVYTTSNAAGGLVIVTAEYGGKSASAELVVHFKPTLDEGEVPDGAKELFDPSKNTAVKGDPLAPEIVYPSAETMFPTNVHRILFQWRAKGLGLFHVRFQGKFIDLSLYTDGGHETCVLAKTGAGCWEASKKVWSWLAGSAAGDSVTVTVEAADASKPGEYYVGESIDVHFSKNAVPGAIYYWSTTQAGTIRATVSDSAPQSFLTPAETGKCVACHTLSRNGKRLGAGVGGENLWVVDVNNTSPPPVVFNSYNNSSIGMAWMTFNYAASRIVYAKGGVLKLIDGDTAAPIGPNGGVIALAPKFGTQPDWAPDDQRLAFTYGAGKNDRGTEGSSIAMLHYGADTFTSLIIVRESTGSSDTYGYPSFDPTSQWLAYMHAPGKSDKNALANLSIAKAEANAPEFALERANTIVGDTLVPSGIANNMPTWAPTETPTETRWIAFASKRDYGLVLRDGSAIGKERQQLWVAAIDPSKLGKGDPSFPAFRLPFQLLKEDNHRPFWAEDALEKEPPPKEPPPCVEVGGDCSGGPCCEGLICQPSADGTAYTCAYPVPN